MLDVGRAERRRFDDIAVAGREFQFHRRPTPLSLLRRITSPQMIRIIGLVRLIRCQAMPNRRMTVTR